MRIEISREDDRLTVASILVKNGYRVHQRREKKPQTNRAYKYYLEIDKPTDKVDETITEHKEGGE